MDVETEPFVAAIGAPDPVSGGVVGPELCLDVGIVFVFVFGVLLVGRHDCLSGLDDTRVKYSLILA